MSTNNLKLWESVETTDPAFTKPLSGLGYSGTGIAPQYLFKRATEAFGPVGDGWGYDIVRSEIIDGHTMRIQRDGEWHDFGPSKVHTCEIRLWYMATEYVQVEKPDGGTRRKKVRVRHEVPGIGHTKFIFLTKDGPMTDWEYEKKSVTDAITKALSFIGFGADVRLGMFEERLRQREEFLETFNSTLALLESASSLHELAAIYNRQLALVERKGTAEELAAFRTMYTNRVQSLKPQLKEQANG